MAHQNAMPPLVRIADLQKHSAAQEAAALQRMEEMHISSEAMYEMSDNEEEEEDAALSDGEFEPSLKVGEQLECPSLEPIGMPYDEKGRYYPAGATGAAAATHQKLPCAVGSVTGVAKLGGGVKSALSAQQRQQIKLAKKAAAARKYCGFPIFDKVITMVGEGFVTEIGDEIFVSHGAHQAFHANILGYDARAIEQSALTAQQFFRSEFGIDFTGITPVMKSGTPIRVTPDGFAAFIPFYLNPLLEFRIYNVSSSKPGVLQPQGSHPVYFGGWAVRILKKDGFRFDAENSAFGRGEGKNKTTYPCETMLLHGDIKIEGLREERVKRMEHNPVDSCAEPVEVWDTKVWKDPSVQKRMTFASRSPFVATPDFIIPMDLSVWDRSLGIGALQGIIKVSAPTDRSASSKHRVEISTVLKFPNFMASESN